MSDLFLTNYNPDLDIIVASNASSFGVGACTLNKMTDEATKSIPHASRVVFSGEKLFAN